MKDLKGKTAVITGGAEGIGFHLARVLAQRGMNIMLADIDKKMLTQAVSALKEEGFQAEGTICDVIRKEDHEKTAQKTLDVFGKIHLLVSNAGVACEGAQHRVEDNDWRWVIEANLMSVVYGAQVYVPIMKSQNEGGHVMNVASIAGMKGFSFAGPYCATKAAVVSLSETWRSEFEGSGIEVSVFCPGFVKSRIYDSKRNRHEQFGGPVYFEDRLKEKPRLAAQKEIVTTGIDTEIAANRALEGLENGEFYIFSHPHFHQTIDERCAELKQAFETAHNSPALETVPKTGLILK